MVKAAKRVFTREFKLEALALLERGDRSAAQIERDLGLSSGLLRHWARQYRRAGAQSFPGSGHQLPAEEELRRVRRELELVRQERDILKKAIAIVTQPSTSATRSSTPPADSSR